MTRFSVRTFSGTASALSELRALHKQRRLPLLHRYARRDARNRANHCGETPSSVSSGAPLLAAPSKHAETRSTRDATTRGATESTGDTAAVPSHSYAGRNANSRAQRDFPRKRLLKTARRRRQKGRRATRKRVSEGEARTHKHRWREDGGNDKTRIRGPISHKTARSFQVSRAARRWMAEGSKPRSKKM